jgi:hypothetical protein
MTRYWLSTARLAPVKASGDRPLEAMAEENAEQARLCKTDHYAEGFRAFQEKR